MARAIQWPTGEVLEANRHRLRDQLRRRLREYEARYEIKSEQVEDELAANRLRDTAEVCDWVITYHTYRSIADG